MESIDAEFPNTTFYSADCDSEAVVELAQKYVLNTMPTLMIFKNGEKVRVVHVCNNLRD